MGLIPLGGPGAAPDRFRIWHAGNNPGDYGDNNVTARAVDAIMAEHAKRGVALAIDIQHATNPRENPKYDPANPPPIAGHAALKVVASADGPELWADPVRWTDCGRPFAVPSPGVCCGKHQIETGQRPYISPDWFLDPATREPRSLDKLSLVAEPGTFKVNMLAARARRSDMNDTDILKALLAAGMGAAASQDPDIQALGALVAGQSNDLATSKGLDLAGADAAEPPASQAAPMAPAPAAAAADACDPKIEKMVAAALAKHGVGVAASKPLTEASVRSILAEDRERSALLDANKDTLGGLVGVLASKPLAEVKVFIAAAASKKTPTGDAVAPRGESLAEPEGSASFSLADRYGKKK